MPLNGTWTRGNSKKYDQKDTETFFEEKMFGCWSKEPSFKYLKNFEKIYKCLNESTDFTSFEQIGRKAT